MNEWECILCEATFDGILHTKPARCPVCKAPERYIISSDEWVKIVKEVNKAINKGEEELENDNS